MIRTRAGSRSTSSGVHSARSAGEHRVHALGQPDQLVRAVQASSGVEQRVVVAACPRLDRSGSLRVTNNLGCGISGPLFSCPGSRSLSPGRPAPSCLGVKRPCPAHQFLARSPARRGWPSLAALATPAGAAAPAVTLLSHRAAYRLSLAQAEFRLGPGPGPRRPGARMAEADCDGWLSQQRLGFVAESDEGPGLQLRRALLELGIARQHPAALQRSALSTARSCRTSSAAWPSSTAPGAAGAARYSVPGGEDIELAGRDDLSRPSTSRTDRGGRWRASVCSTARSSTGRARTR